MRTPGFVDQLQSKATLSTIKISWNAPTTRTHKVMDVDHYIIKCRYRFNQATTDAPFSIKTTETRLNLSTVNQYTDMFLTIAAVFQGRIGPEVMIVICTGNDCVPLVIKTVRTRLGINPQTAKKKFSK